MADGYRVELASGSLRDAVDATWTAPHPWTTGGVAVSFAFTGAHLLNAAVGGWVLNDLHREAGALGVVLRGVEVEVEVEVEGGFDASWASTGTRYRVELDVAEIPRAIRAGTEVRRDG